MLAEQLEDEVAAARCSALIGRVLFERDRISASVEHHVRAERTYASGAGGPAARAENLVRLAISERELGHLEESRRHLRRAIDVGGNDPDLRVRAVTNLGATYFHVDWGQTRRLWEKALELARENGLVDREIHLLLDLNRLNVLEKRSDVAARVADQISKLLEDLRLDYPRLRFLNQQGVRHGLAGDLQLAVQVLRDAEEYAVRHLAIRRLWKIRANLATIYEGVGAMTDAYAADVLVELDTSRLLREETLDRPTPQRALLPVANMILRREASEAYNDLAGRLPADICAHAQPLAEAVEEGRVSSIPFSLARHCAEIGGRNRFVLP